MAVPTFTSVTPAEGLPSGRGRVRIAGSGFRTPAEPPPFGSDPPLTGKTGDFIQWLRTVRVDIDGQRADDVIPISDTLLYVITPAYVGLPANLPAAVDISITNLDDSGVPIGGETVTAAAAFTYRRQNLTVDSDIAWVERNILDRFARNIVENVAANTGLDYANSPASGLLAVADLPAIILFGPDLEEDEEGDERNEHLFPPDPDGGSNDVLVNASPLPTSLVWRILVLSDDKPESLNLANLVTRDLWKRPTLVMESEEGAGDEIEFDLFLDEPFASSDDFGHEVHGYESTLRLRGLLLDDSYGIEAGGVPIEGVVAPESDDNAPTLQIQEGLT